jgi:hypothetical protein
VVRPGWGPWTVTRVVLVLPEPMVGRHGCPRRSWGLSPLASVYGGRGKPRALGGLWLPKGAVGPSLVAGSKLAAALASMPRSCGGVRGREIGEGGGGDRERSKWVNIRLCRRIFINI